MSSYRKPEFFRSLLHPAMSVAVSASSALTAVLLVAQILGTPGVRPIMVVAIVLAPFVEAIVGNLLYAERAGVGNRIRELVIYLLLVYTGCSLGRPGPLLARFVPGADQLLPILIAGLTWFLAFGIHNKLRGRESLLKAFSGKTGSDLRHALVDRQHDMALTVGELRRARGLIGGVFFMLSVLTVTAASGLLLDASLPPSSPAFILMCFTGVVTAISIGTLNAYIDEYAANGLGLSVPFRFQRRRLIVGSVLALLAMAAAYSLSREESLLPLESIGAFFRWFAGLFERDGPRVLPEPRPRQNIEPSYYQLLQELLAEAEPRVPPLWTRILAELLRRLAVSVAFAAAALLIFGPMFSPAFREGLKRLRPLSALRNLFRRTHRQMIILARWLRAWFRGVFSARVRATGRKDEEVYSTGAPGKSRGWRPSLHKRRQMDRVVAVFASVARWGDGHGVRYRRSDGASEYLRQISELYPEQFAEAQTCARLFWEARYSTRTLSMGEMREYVRSAKRITEAG